MSASEVRRPGAGMQQTTGSLRAKSEAVQP
ncbi:type VI secretion system baseplate subunit TssE, partial [Mesorhizobium sp. M7A.F.Ca.US.007.01.2.1]